MILNIETIVLNSSKLSADTYLYGCVFIRKNEYKIKIITIINTYELIEL